MIYSAALSVPVKKAMKEKGVQSSINTIINNLPLDPDVTTMDVVILGPHDVVGARAHELSTALEHKHPDICVIYIYTKDSEKDYVGDYAYKMCVKKIKEGTILKAVEEFLSDHVISTGQTFVSTTDFEDAEPVDPPEAGEPYPAARRRMLFGRRRTVQEPPEENVTEVPDTAPINRVGVPANTVGSSEYETADEDDISEVALNSGDEINQDGDDGLGTVSEIPVGDTESMPTLSEMMQTLMKESDEDEESSDAGKALTSSAVHDSLNPTMPAQPSEMASFTEQLENIKSVMDWDVFKEVLNRDSMTKRLIEANSEFAGLVNMLDVLDNRIQAVFRDTSLTAEQKFDEIKGIGLERSVAKAAQNSIYVDKLIRTLENITRSAKDTVEKTIEQTKESMSKLRADRSVLEDTSSLDKLIQLRSKAQLDLLNLGRSIVDLYKAMDLSVTEEINALDSKLPSDSEYINNMMSPVGAHIFTPSNTAALANKLLQALADNRMTASQLENSVDAMVNALFELCETDENIIKEQQKTIEILKANRVEDVVIIDSVLKSALRVYIGSSNSGHSATAITWSGILSRRQNSLLVDLSGNNKFATYGLDAVPMQRFLYERIERQFLCVYTEEACRVDEIDDIIRELRTRLNYYPYINIILHASQIDLLNIISKDTLTVHYVTNCTQESMNAVENIVKQHKSDNLAKKLITIGAPVSPFMLADKMGIDVTTTKIVLLPEMPEIKGCAIRNDRTFEHAGIVSVFEEAFK